jgi:MOSC N-terminal beta barrel domain
MTSANPHLPVRTASGTPAPGDGRPVGWLRDITRFAVKAVGGERMTEADVAVDGIAHDRRYAVVAESGHYL